MYSVFKSFKKRLCATLVATILLLWPIMGIHAQSTRAYVGLGATYHAFQDARFSDLQITSFSPDLELGFRHVIDHSYITAHVDGFIFITPQPNAVEMNINSMGFNVRAGYLYGITSGLFVGGTWDLLDFTTRNTDGLGNNENFYLNSSDLFLSVKYLLSAGRNWSFEFGGDLGLVSFMKYAPSFTANMDQKAIDDGEASYQDMNIRDPWSFAHINTKPIGTQFTMRTHIEAFFRRRLSAAYIWNMRSFADQKGYPLTMAGHSLVLRYHFVSRPK
ncbi:MAG: hypothetical protein ACWGNV_16540 [Bacteroidales bacterium]